ncbi:TPA: hypothetical protein JI333_RS05235 [Acinetobacter baumannii]|nr:hypothetical protein [Acinetobacter baumannii]
MSEFEGKSGKWAWEIQKEQQANLDELKKSKNTMNSSEYLSVFKSIFSLFHTSKKPDVRDRALGVH